MKILMPFENMRIWQPLFDRQGMDHPGNFSLDIREKETGWELKADLPGFKKEDIHLDLQNDWLTIEAKRHSDWEDEEKKQGYVRCERSFGRYHRCVDVSGVETADITASYENGVLTVDLPKKKVQKPESRRIALTDGKTEVSVPAVPVETKNEA